MELDEKKKEKEHIFSQKIISKLFRHEFKCKNNKLENKFESNK